MDEIAEIENKYICNKKKETYTRDDMKTLLTEITRLRGRVISCVESIDCTCIPNKIIDDRLNLLRETDFKVLLVISRLTNNNKIQRKILHKDISEISHAALNAISRSLKKLIACDFIRKFPEDKFYPDYYEIIKQ